MFCNNCGRQLKEGAAFCDGCGMPVQAMTGVPQMRAKVPKDNGNGASAAKHRKKIIISAALAVAALATVVFFVRSGRTGQTEDAEEAAVNADASETEKAEETAQTQETEKTAQIQETEKETDSRSNQNEQAQPDNEDEMSVLEEYADVETSVWKTEEHYQHTQEGEEYLACLIEYDSREHEVRRCYYNEDGSVLSEVKSDNRYDREGKLLSATNAYDDDSIIITEYDESERETEGRQYDEHGRLGGVCPYSYEYDEQEDVWDCDYIWLFYDLDGEYTSSGFSNHEVISYDEQGRITAHYYIPYTINCYMYDKTEEEIRQEFAGISPKSENWIYREIAHMAEAAEDVPIQVYCYDGKENLQNIINYHISDGSFSQEASCTYEYDSAGNVRTSRMESESETVVTVYNRTVLQNPCGIQEVTWEEGGLTKPALQFLLENGDVIERKAAYEGSVDHVEYKDITGDGFCEAFVYIGMPDNYTDAYYRIAVYQVQEGNVIDISPFVEFHEEATYWDTEIVEEPETEYGMVLQLDTYDQIPEGEDLVAYVAERLTIGYQKSELIDI